MSKIGQLPIKIPAGTTVTVTGDVVTVSGPKGNLTFKLHRGLEVNQKDGVLTVSQKAKNQALSPVYGTARAIINNMVNGVTTGWKKTLELVGAGYRAEVNGGNLVLTVGFSHPVTVKAPEGITFKVEKSVITVEGPNRETVGQVSAEVRKVRPPEPYKGKGIKYQDEVVRRKAGKAAKTAGAA